MGRFIDVTDLAPFASIADAKAEAMAVLAPPCINTDTFESVDAVKAVLRAAILRWNSAGDGALQAKTIGPFGETYDTRQERRGMFWPSEIVALQNLCVTYQGGAYTVSLAGPDPVLSSVIPLA